MDPERTVVIATTNAKKGGEMMQILKAALPGLDFVPLSAFPDMPEVAETGETFIENARLKAVATTRHTRLTAVADDGGLVIDALGGQPGVRSHRFLGAETPFEVKMARILEMMRDVPEEQRTARFVCAVVIATPEGQIFTCQGACEGRIARAMRGSYGFGYDPIFYLPEQGRHMAELPPEEKHRISHRGKALAEAVTYLQRLFQVSP